MDRRTFMLAAPLALAACASRAPEGDTAATREAIERVAYRHPGPSYLTLITMRNTGSDNGAHSALFINASQRVIWDPAGSFGHPSIVERGDVHFGATPQIEQYYISYHSRVTYYSVLQTVIVPDDVAEMALRLAMENGASPRAFCTTHISTALRKLPGFGSIRTTFFPDNLNKQFARIPGVTTREYRETDSGDLRVARDELNRQIENSETVADTQ